MAPDAEVQAFRDVLLESPRSLGETDTRDASPRQWIGRDVYSGVWAKMICPDQQDDEEAESGEDDGESFLSVFRHLHRRNVDGELAGRLCLSVFGGSIGFGHRPSLNFVHNVFRHDLQQILFLP